MRRLGMAFALAWLGCTTLCAASEFTFVQVCDTQLGRGGYDHDKEELRRTVLLANCMVPAPEFVVFCGDLRDTAKSGQGYQDFKALANDLKMPYYCALGNNDAGDVPAPASLQEFRTEIGPDYFTFDHMGFTFIVVDTQIWKSPLAGETDQQNTWLHAQLQAVRQQGSPAFVIGHYPFFVASIGETESHSNLPEALRQPWLDEFASSGVVAYLAGHLHLNITQQYAGMQLVTSASTCQNLGLGPLAAPPLGFRVWHVGASRPYANNYEAIEVDPTTRDADADGLTDAQEDVNGNWRVDPGETNAFNADTDGDGLTDGIERMYGSDPLVPNHDKVPALSPLGLAVLMFALYRVALKRA